MTLPWIMGAAAVGVLAGPPLRSAVITRYGAAPPVLAVAAVGGAALAVVAARAPAPWPLAALGWLMLCGVTLAFIDAAVRRLPDPLTAAALLGTLTLLAVAALTAGHPGALARAALGAVALSGFYLLLFLIRPSGMGPGDIKLAASVGAGLAWLGWPALIEATLVTYVLAAAYGIALLLTHRATRTSQLPLGPFIILGALAAIAL
jgi:leader peptidase (prepilin peptidase)/N-methyltransferase